MRLARIAPWPALLTLAAIAAPAAADNPSGATPERQSLDDAWWTGPLLAASAGTLPKGHLLIEPYLFDSIPYARFDGKGASHSAPHANDFGSLTYLNYGLTDRLTVGVIPHFGYDRPKGGPGSSGVGVGDVTVQAQYGLTKFHEGGWLPTIGLNLAETLPLGRYDRLDRASDGFGAGAYTTALSLYSQSYFWMPNGRVLRARLNLSYAMSTAVSVDDLSVYGTAPGFHGRAKPGASGVVNLAAEYSATRNWVLAVDLWAEGDGAGKVLGTAPLGGSGPLASFQASSGVGRSFYVAPAVEYNWSSRAGVIIGARLTPAGRNTTASVTPVIAVNYVY